MSPRTSDQWSRIREEKKEIILDTALALFARRGFYNTPISLIAKEAGISKGLIYNYFDSKESLLYEIISSGMNDLVSDLKYEEERGVTRDELIHYVEVSFTKIKKNSRFYRLFFSLILQPEVFSIFQDKFLDQILPWFALLERYYSEKGEKFPQAKARFFGAALDGIGLNYIAEPDHFPLEEIKKLFLEMFI